MPKKVVKGSFADRVREAHEAHKSDPTTMGGGGGLPAGIEGGIARLSDIRIGYYEKGDNVGEPFFIAAGIVLSPESHDGIVVKGLRTQIMEPIHDTPTRSRKTVEDHYAWVLNQVRLLGVDTSEVDVDSFEDVLAALKESKPYFRFRTWKGSKQEITKRADGKFECSGKVFSSEAMAKAAFPFAGNEPRVQEEWRGACEYTEDGGDDGVVEETAEPEEEVATTPPWEKGEAEEAPAKAPTKKAPAKTEPEDEDLDALAETAQGGDAEAQQKLEGLAKLHNVEGYEAMETWAEVAEAIKSASEAPDEAAEEEFVPEKDGLVKYKPPKAKKPIECTVIAVLPKTQTANLKSLEDGKTVFKGVAWAELSPT